MSVDALLAFHPQRKHHEFDLRSPAQRSRMRKRMEAEVIQIIAEGMYEVDMTCRERLGRKCKKLRESPEFVFVAMMLQDRIKPMEIVPYLRRCDPQNFAQNLMTDDALRVQIERMRSCMWGRSRGR